MDTLVSHWSMTFNPRYGMVGLFSMPYNWIFELFGAAIETIGYFLIPFSLIMGNEATGLPASFAKVGCPVRIEHTNNIDSLNLPIATSIGLYEATKGGFGE